MNRFKLLQDLINLHGYEMFLEIGTHKGKTFLPLKCKYKIAVDPSFRIPIPFFLKQLIINPANFRNRYFSMTSDAFFAKKTRYLEKKYNPDLIFIDGLHTFEASLKDVLNSLKYLNSKGTIVLHDCFPPSKASATPAKSLKEAAKMDIPDWTGAWCGDVWKTMAYLKKKYDKDLEIQVLNVDLGLGIIRLKENRIIDRNLDPILFDSINQKSFEELQEDPEALIGLFELKDLDKYIINKSLD